MLVAIFTSHFLEVNLSFLLIAVSILFALLPDIDFVFKKYNGKYAHKHRDFLHLPLLYLPIGTAVVCILFGKIWGTVFLLSSFLHFLHDSIGIGWGVKWLFPFSKNNYAFFYLYSRKIKEGLRKNIFIFNEDNLQNMADEHGDPDWIKNIYCKWHSIAIIEFLFFIFSAIFLLISLQK